MTGVLLVLGIVAMVLTLDVLIEWRIARAWRRVRVDGDHTTRARFLGGRR